MSRRRDRFRSGPRGPRCRRARPVNGQKPPVELGDRDHEAGVPDLAREHRLIDEQVVSMRGEAVGKRGQAPAEPGRKRGIGRVVGVDVSDVRARPATGRGRTRPRTSPGPGRRARAVASSRGRSPRGWRAPAPDDATATTKARPPHPPAAPGEARAAIVRQPDARRCRSAERGKRGRSQRLRRRRRPSPGR